MSDTSPAVNPQIVDAATTVNVKVLAEAPAEAMGFVYQAAGQSLALALLSASHAQAGLTQIGQAIVGVSSKLICALETKS